MNTQPLWQPSATITTLKQRAAFLSQIRRFFAERNVLEVDTPTLSRGTVTDVHLDAFKATFHHDVSGISVPLYLQTSPEFAMKRLLCTGSGPIFQICKAFRNEAGGRFHNPEFTMLEWYRTDFNDHQLMTEIDELMQTLLDTPKAQKVTYQQAFIDELGIDPLSVTIEELKAFILKTNDDRWLQDETDKDVLLQWLFSMKVEPNLGKKDDKYRPCFVYDFPASQASLAKLNSTNPKVAHRFELYFKGIELANGFYELQNGNEQRGRFERDNQLRKNNEQPQRPIDHLFLDALDAGLPDCSGVAIGVDRLLMLKINASSISEVISFDISRC